MVVITVVTKGIPAITDRLQQQPFFGLKALRRSRPPFSMGFFLRFRGITPPIFLFLMTNPLHFILQLTFGVRAMRIYRMLFLALLGLISNFSLAMDNVIKVKFDDGVSINLDLDAAVKIIDHQKETSFGTKGKPSYMAPGNVKITELSGMNSDKTKERSWTLVQLPPGSSTAKHSHLVATEEHYAVTELTLEVAGIDHGLQAGQFFKVTPKTAHRIKNTTSQSAVLLVKSTPAGMRSDLAIEQ